MTPGRRPTRRLLLVELLLVAITAVPVLIAFTAPLRQSSAPQASLVTVSGGVAGASATPQVAIPAPGHEVYGFVPYWEMDNGIAAHVARTPLTTLALFSVSATGSGSLGTKAKGYRKITGDIGARLIRDAHRDARRVELVFTSFGSAKNARFFSRPTAEARAIVELVALAQRLDVDGINVDVELIDLERIAGYGQFVGELREALRAKIPRAQVSVATTGGPIGALMALAASQAGADRVFVMAYDYHAANSQPGASAPLGRRDGDPKTLSWSLDLYREVGVPVERTILGLPLYGMSWPASGPEIGAPQVGKGTAWIPRRHLDTLADRTLTPTFDALEGVEFLALRNGSGWRAVYYDSPTSLMPKLLLADQRGLAGAGFWAIGYERGLPEYTDLIKRFHSGSLGPAG